jgi:hypothetical protein
MAGRLDTLLASLFGVADDLARWFCTILMEEAIFWIGAGKMATSDFARE